MIEVADGKPGPALKRLRRLMHEVEEVKTRQQRDLEQEAKDALHRLDKSAPGAVERHLRSDWRGDEQKVKGPAEK